MADTQAVRDMMRKFVTETTSPVAFDRHYRVPIYDTSRAGIRMDPYALYFHRRPNKSSAEQPGPTILYNGKANPRSLRPGQDLESFMQGGAPALLSHEITHHIQGQDPALARRIADKIEATDGVERSAYNRMVNQLYGDQHHEAQAFVLSDTLGEQYLRSGAMGRLLPGVEGAPRLDILAPNVLERLQHLMYGELDDRAKAALKNRQRTKP